MGSVPRRAVSSVLCITVQYSNHRIKERGKRKAQHRGRDNSADLEASTLSHPEQANRRKPRMTPCLFLCHVERSTALLKEQEKGLFWDSARTTRNRLRIERTGERQREEETREDMPQAPVVNARHATRRSQQGALGCVEYRQSDLIAEGRQRETRKVAVQLAFPKCAASST